MKKVTLAVMAAMVLVTGAMAGIDPGTGSWTEFLQTKEIQDKLNSINERWAKEKIIWTLDAKGAKQPSVRLLEKVCDDQELKELFQKRNIIIESEISYVRTGEKLIPYVDMRTCGPQREFFHLYNGGSGDQEPSLIYVKKIK